MSLNSESRIEVFNAFEALKDSLNLLEEAVCQWDATLPGWFQPPPKLGLSESLCAREKAMAFIYQLEYLNNQAPKEILVGAGVFAASDLTLERVEAVNGCKNRFKAAMLALKGVSVKDRELNDYFEKTLMNRPAATTHALQKMGFARLHLKQCYRRIPCLIRRPLKVSWTWAHTKAITCISVEEAECLLKKKKSKAAAYQLSKLYTLDSREPLAIVQNLAPHLRANVVFPDGRRTRCAMVKGSVPLFYPAEDLRLPEIYPPAEKHERDEERPIRSDVQLEPEPFLPLIRTHRYLKNCY